MNSGLNGLPSHFSKPGNKIASVLNISGTASVTSPSTAVLQIGLPDSNTPTAHTLQHVSVLAGNTNTAGPNFTTAGSRGTGTGAGGSLLFQVAPAGSTGVSQNALATALTIDSTKLATFTGDVKAGSGTGTFIGQYFQFESSGAYFAFAGASTIQFTTNGGTAFNITVAAANTLQFGTPDAAGPNAFTLKAQSVVAGNSNVAGVNLTLKGSLSTGSGVSGDIIFQTGGTGAGSTSQNTATTALTIKGATQEIICAAPIRFAGYTVATLPAGNAGDNAYVTDALAPTFLATVVGGGAIVTPVFYNGSAWVGA